MYKQSIEKDHKEMVNFNMYKIASSYAEEHLSQLSHLFAKA